MKAIVDSPTSVRYQITAPHEIVEEKLLEAFCHQIAGSAEGIAVKAGADKVSAGVAQNDGGYEVFIKWE